jgi:hypothetical protein
MMTGDLSVFLKKPENFIFGLMVSLGLLLALDKKIARS